MRRRRVPDRIRIRFTVFFLLAILLGGYLFLRGRFIPIVQDLARTQVMNQSSDLINDAITEQIALENVEYDRIIYFEKDLQGKITALKTNISEINKLKTDVLNIINDEILSMDTHDIGIPLGSIILPELFSGKGPYIPVRVISISNSDAQFSSQFSEAGINQTLHQLNMEVSVDVTILVLSQTETFHISSPVVVAETVIVGTVPDTFLHAEKGA